MLSINNAENPITVGVLYRPPSGDATLFFSELNLILQKRPLTNVYLSGDFNIDLLKNTAVELEDIIYGNGFAPHNLNQVIIH